MDVCSGAVHVVDDVTYDLIEEYAKVYEAINPDDEKKQRDLTKEEVDGIVSNLSSKYSTDDLKESLEEIEELISDEMLFAPDEYRNIIFEFKKRKTIVKALCLNISHDCNLACR
ncbi:MAG: thioether cross-link-forming SCIFF peptide maturase, partial [Lachnospiraceae bacterium]|nr:thioether cross-link-forming SCIFF peptide maturase [Lachnospiraceae bacterium]